MQDFEKGGGPGNAETLRRTSFTMKIFCTLNQFDFPIFSLKLGEDQKKGLHSDLVRFWPKTKVFAYPLCAQSFCPTYKGKGGGMPQFCILFYAYYTILATQEEGPCPS